MYLCLYIYIHINIYILYIYILYIYICVCVCVCVCEDISYLLLLSGFCVGCALFCCFCCWLRASWYLLVISDFISIFASTNDIFDLVIYFIVIFWSIRLFFTVNISCFNNYLIYFNKWQVFMVLWFFLKLHLILGLRFVAISQFTSIAGSLAGFWMVRVYGWWGFSNRF